MEINYLAIIVSAVLAMVVGAIWYGPLFERKWLEIIGASDLDLEEREKMKKKAGPLYGVQLMLTLFQVTVLAHLIADTTTVSGLERAIWIWAAFVIPTLAAASMWTNDSTRIKWSRFLIQGGYQLVIFVMFGTILMLWK